MLTYMEYLGVPATIIIIVVAIFLFIQIIGELLEFKGKVVPEFFKIRKHFARKKEEREIIAQMPKAMQEIKQLLKDFDTRREVNDEWIDCVNKRLTKGDAFMVDLDSRVKELNQKLDKSNDDILNLIIEDKRNTIIDFASYVVDGKRSVTREQFKRIFKLHDEYEELIKENNLTNGEVNTAFRIIIDSYEEHMRNHTFVEDVRGYDMKL